MTATSSPAPLLQMRGITKRFPGVTALADVSLTLRPGEVLALMGENGAGKSTLMKILSGVIPDYEGQLLLRGQPVRFGGTRDADAVTRQAGSPHPITSTALPARGERVSAAVATASSRLVLPWALRPTTTLRPAPSSTLSSA